MWEYMKGSEVDFDGAPDWALMRIKGKNTGKVYWSDGFGEETWYSQISQLPRIPVRGHLLNRNYIVEAARQREADMNTRRNDEVLASEVQVGGDHYRSMKIQPIDFILANNIGFCEANAIKYLCRWKSKNGIEDLKKARHYIDLLIEKGGE